jgi:hypothetical protein
MKARMRRNTYGCATSAICDEGADARQQRPAMKARMRDISDLR